MSQFNVVLTRALCVLFFGVAVAALGLGQRASAAKLLTRAELSGLLGGACPKQDCVVDTCNTAGCAYNTACAVRTDGDDTFCAGIVVANGEKCGVAGMGGNNICSQTTANPNCGTVLYGAVSPNGTCLGGGACNMTPTPCGGIIHSCTQTACTSD